MRTRWIVAAVVACVLASLTLTLPPHWLGGEGTTGAACPTDAKQANLDFTLKDVSRQDVHLADYRGKVLLLDFWATWCGPCRIEIPGFVNLYQKYKPQGFEVVGVVVQDEFSAIAPFAAEYRMNYTVLDGIGREDIEAAFGPFVGLPTSLLIDREGRVCGRHLGLPLLKSFDGPLQKAVEEFFEAEIRALL